jgi:hypothetical protein
MAKRRRLNKRLDASHVRLYRRMMDSLAYLLAELPSPRGASRNRKRPRRH